MSLQFETTINAPREKVWDTLWDDATYRQWTAPFMEGSHAKSDWNEGSRIEFLGPDGSGMYATIEKKVPNETMIFRHQGELKNGVEEPKDWPDSTESYFLEATSDGGTRLRTEMGATGDMEAYFKETFPKALAEIKRLAEQ